MINYSIAYKIFKWAAIFAVSMLGMYVVLIVGLLHPLRPTKISQSIIKHTLPINAPFEVIPQIKANNTFVCKVEKSFFLPIFMYHHVRPITPDLNRIDIGLTITPELFEEQIKTLSAHGYEFLNMTDFLEIMAEKKPIPEKAVVLTFDDGYDDFNTYAIPILKKYNAHASVFLIGYYLGSKSGTNRYLNDEEIKQLMQLPGIEFESHTLTHPDLAKIKESRLEEEVFYSKKYLEQTFHKDFDIFSYPGGTYSDLVVLQTKKAGYYAAVSTKGGAYHSCETIYELRRIRTGTYDALNIEEKLKELKRAIPVSVTPTQSATAAPR